MAAGPHRKPPTRGRVVVAKAGLDGHDRGAKVIARGFRDAGLEVIYAGIRRSPEEIAETVLQEDADILGISVLSGAVVPLTRRIMDALTERGLNDVIVLVGGIASPSAVASLRQMGVAGAFGPGTKIETIVTFADKLLAARRVTSADANRGSIQLASADVEASASDSEHHG